MLQQLKLPPEVVDKASDFYDLEQTRDVMVERGTSKNGT